MSGRGYIAEEPPQACQMCGVIAECRPYGPKDEEICFECAQKDPETTERKMAIYLFGEDDE
jgi:hypothetical protein